MAYSPNAQHTLLRLPAHVSQPGSCSQTLWKPSPLYRVEAAFPQNQGTNMFLPQLTVTWSGIWAIWRPLFQNQANLLSSDSSILGRDFIWTLTRKKVQKLGTVWACNPSTWEAGLGGPGVWDHLYDMASSRPAWATRQTLSKKKKKTNINKKPVRHGLIVMKNVLWKTSVVRKTDP